MTLPRSGYTGVNFYPKLNKWRAYVMVKFKYIHLGYYKTREEAIAARKRHDETTKSLQL